MGLLGTWGNLEQRWGKLKRLWGNLEHEIVCAVIFIVACVKCKLS